MPFIPFNSLPRLRHLVIILMVAAFALGTGCLSAQTPPAPAEELDIRGPKPLIEIPEPEKPNYPLWLAIAGGSAALAVAAFFWHRHNRRKILKTPRKIALESLTDLAATRDQLNADDFANRAASSIRRYISERFGIVAPRRTTEEFLRELTTHEQSPLIPEAAHLKNFLKSCDLAKFAGTNLDHLQRIDLIEAARNFINVTDARTNEPKPEAPVP